MVSLILPACRHLQLQKTDPSVAHGSLLQHAGRLCLQCLSAVERRGSHLEPKQDQQTEGVPGAAGESAGGPANGAETAPQITTSSGHGEEGKDFC